MPHKKILSFQEKITAQINAIGNILVEFFHYAALFAIGFIIAWAALIEFKIMILNNRFNIEGILTLFIYLELGAMIGIYFKTQHMPVRYLIYIAITALTRLLLLEVSHHDPDLQAGSKILIESAAILLLCFAVLVIRIASVKFPSHKDESDDQY